MAWKLYFVIIYSPTYHSILKLFYLFCETENEMLEFFVYPTTKVDCDFYSEKDKYFKKWVFKLVLRLLFKESILNKISQKLAQAN